MTDQSQSQFDIVAFEVPKHRSLLYETWQSREQLHGANVFSIRKVVKE